MHQLKKRQKKLQTSSLWGGKTERLARRTPKITKSTKTMGFIVLWRFPTKSKKVENPMQKPLRLIGIPARGARREFFNKDALFCLCF